MNSIDPECTPLKTVYDTCFNTWYSEKFLKGVQSDECEELFTVYQACVKKALKEKDIDIEEEK